MTNSFYVCFPNLTHNIQSHFERRFSYAREDDQFRSNSSFSSSSYAYDGPIYADGDLPPDHVVTNLQSTLRPQGYCDAEAEWKALFTSLAGQLANDVNELLTALC